MSEVPPFVDQLHRDLRAVGWPEPAEIRARARRRSRRTAALSALTVLALLAGSAVAVRERSTAQSSAPAAPVAASTPVRAEIPLDALLAPADLLTEARVRLGGAGLGETVRVDPLLESCGREREVAAQLPVSRASRSQTLLRSPDGADAPAGPVLTQDVYRIEPTRGRWFFDEIDRLLDACARWNLVTSTLTTGQQPARTHQEHRWEPSVRDFAGDQSVLLRHVALQPRAEPDGKPVGTPSTVENTLVVRVGDLVTVVVPARETVVDRADDDTGPGIDYGPLIDVGKAAASRLCPAATRPAGPPC
ncbi:hypothetical protein [Micromonospora rifamycinica]|uniref:Uncharacterized protein n=1 Tax=Micromonospora rifamycinica TaxID=291594 RepID=A0A109INQ8_9ACTN|nr:hypothetical protein [Micromonospora rifamycinica]KWV33896.1 hypothetical protein AWV63_04685 [Micromonospora rifamycinica]SCG61662.1 hypothetical protein GA0070623_2865 [Micromonospora rifamycinica]